MTLEEQLTMKKTWARGRKRVSDEPIISTHIKLTASDRVWLQSRGEIAATIRQLIQQAKKEESHKEASVNDS